MEKSIKSRGSARIGEFLLDYKLVQLNLIMAHYAAARNDRNLFEKCGSRIEKLAEKYVQK